MTSVGTDSGTLSTPSGSLIQDRYTTTAIDPRGRTIHFDDLVKDGEIVEVEGYRMVVTYDPLAPDWFVEEVGRVRTRTPQRLAPSVPVGTPEEPWARLSADGARKTAASDARSVVPGDLREVALAVNDPAKRTSDAA